MTLAKRYIPVVRFGLQTNAILLNQEFIEVFRYVEYEQAQVSMGSKLINDARGLTIRAVDFDR